MAFQAVRLRKAFESAALRGQVHVDALAALIVSTGKDIEAQWKGKADEQSTLGPDQAPAQE